MLNCWRLLANIASFWSNSVATSNEIGSFGFDVLFVVVFAEVDDVADDEDDEDDDVACGRDGGGVCGCSLVTTIDVWDGNVAMRVGGGGDDEEEAAAGAGWELALLDGFVLLRLRGWY